jgi:hypothetical protein
MMDDADWLPASILAIGADGEQYPNFRKRHRKGKYGGRSKD